MSDCSPAGVASLRYRHLGPDPIAKQLYAVVFEAFQTYVKAKTALEQYLDTAPDTIRPTAPTGTAPGAGP